MQEAIPYKIWLPISQQPFPSRSPVAPPKTTLNNKKSANKDGSNSDAPKGDYIKNMVTENAVIVLGRRGCCMSHVVKRLLQGLGVNPAVYEVDEDDESGVVHELESIVGGDRQGEGQGEGGRLQFPAVFIGGKLFGGLDRIMATHITGELIPILKQAGALWL